MTGFELHRTFRQDGHVAGPLATRLHPPPPETARRVVNLIVASAGLLFAGPVMVVVAALIKLTSRGPVLYSQTRIGVDRRVPGNVSANHRRQQDRGGKPFTIYKFRTMNGGPSNGGAEVWATQDDPRITPVGRVLRKYRLDELPQFFNVLRGDMNVVGPRPEQPAIFARLRAEVPGYQARQRVPPGITGWAQVNQRYDTSIDDVRRKVELDLEYVSRQSVLEDLKILVRTVPVVLLRKGGW
jgi:lipopolysaccharide/colanic/teichoic acid biosynthesis glycosyltransferase